MLQYLDLSNNQGKAIHQNQYYGLSSIVKINR